MSNKSSLILLLTITMSDLDFVEISIFVFLLLMNKCIQRIIIRESRFLLNKIVTYAGKLIVSSKKNCHNS